MSIQVHASLQYKKKRAGVGVLAVKKNDKANHGAPNPGSRLCTNILATPISQGNSGKPKKI